MIGKTILEGNGTSSKRNLYIKGIIVLVLMAVSAIAILAMLQVAQPAQTTQTNQNQIHVKVPVQVDPNTPVALPNAKIGVMTTGYDSATDVVPTQDISVMVGLNYQNQAQLNTFLQQVQDPLSPLYHKFMSRSDFINTYSPSVSVYNKMVSYFNSKGFKVR